MKGSLWAAAAAELLLLQAHAFAAGKIPPLSLEIGQNWCFCLQYSTPAPNGLMSCRLSPLAAPPCAGIRFDDGKKGAVDELHTCEDLGQCWRASSSAVAEAVELEKKLSVHIKELAACRRPVPGIPRAALAWHEEACSRAWKSVVEQDALAGELLHTRVRMDMHWCLAATQTRASAKTQLRGPDREKFLDAALFLAARDTAAVEAIPVLSYAAGRSDTGCKAIKALGNYGSAANSAVTALACIAQKEELKCPGASTATLALIGTPDARAALALLRKWERKWSPREERLFHALSDRDPAVRGNAAAELSGTAITLKSRNDEPEKMKESMAALKALLRDPQKGVRYRTALYLTDIYAVRAGTTSHPPPAYRSKVPLRDATRLSSMPAADTEAVHVLIEAVKDEELPDYSGAAFAALLKYGSGAGAPASVLSDPALLKRLGYFMPQNSRLPRPLSPPVSWRSAPLMQSDISGWRGRNRPLLKALKDKDPSIRVAAARQLCSAAHGSNYVERAALVRFLQGPLRDKNKVVRYEAAFCQASVAVSTRAIPVLIEALKNPSYSANAALVLGRYGGKAGAAVPELARLVNEKGFSYFWLQPASDYATALERIGTPEAMAALKPLREKELLMGALATPFAFLAFIPPLAPLTAIFFAWLFLRSRSQNLKGRKLVHLPLLVPVFAWLYIACSVMSGLGKYNDYGHPFTANICLWLSVISTVIGLVPWGVSWCLLRLRERREPAGKAAAS